MITHITPSYLLHDGDTLAIRDIRAQCDEPYTVESVDDPARSRFVHIHARHADTGKPLYLPATRDMTFRVIQP